MRSRPSDCLCLPFSTTLSERSTPYRWLPWAFGSKTLLPEDKLGLWVKNQTG